MDISLYISAFLFALAGSVHCLSMCTPILGIIGINSELKRSEIAIFYNLGRILTYILLGALFGFLGSMVQNYLNEIKYLQDILKYLAALVMFLFALSLFGLPKAILYLEKAGNVLWRHIAPYAKKALPIKTRKSAVFGGMIWGLLPCGMVYAGGLIISLGSGGLISGALIMLAFGLGTLPSMMSMAFGVAWLTKYIQYKHTKILAGMIMLIMILVYLLDITKIGHDGHMQHSGESKADHTHHNMHDTHQAHDKSTTKDHAESYLHSDHSQHSMQK